MRFQQLLNRIKEAVRYLFPFKSTFNEIHCITGMVNIQLKQMSAEGSEQWVVGVDVSGNMYYRTGTLGSQLTDYYFIIYQMGILCGGAHEISGIKAPIFLHGWEGGGGVGGDGSG